MYVYRAERVCAIALQVHSACRDIIDLKGANTRECTYRDLWHMILIPQAITHRMAIKSHREQEAESTGGREEGGGDTPLSSTQILLCAEKYLAKIGAREGEGCGDNCSDSGICVSGGIPSRGSVTQLCSVCEA